MLAIATIKLPDDLIVRANEYAHKHNTTVTAIIRSHLDQVTAVEGDTLIEYSQGDLTKKEAIEALGLRDYSQLLVALGDADLPLPALPEAELETQAELFSTIWRNA